MPDKWKECSKCGRLLKLSYYWKRAGNSDGRHSQCKVCIKSGKTYERQQERSRKYKRTRAQSALSGLKWKSKKLGLPFDLTEEWLKKKFAAGICEATGEQIDNSEYPSGSVANDMAPTVDRIEPAKGYIQDNCRVVSYKFNVMKNKWPDKELIRVGDLMQERMEFMALEEIFRDRHFIPIEDPEVTDTI